MTLVELYSKPGAWTNGRMARDANDQPIDYMSDGACKFCLFGALSRFYKYYQAAEKEFKIRTVLDKRGYNVSYIEWNDMPGRTQEEVLELCQEAGV